MFCAAAHAHRAGKQPLCEAGGINSADGRRDISSVFDRKCRIPSWRVGHLRHLPEGPEFNSLIHTRYSIYWSEKIVNLKYHEYTRLASWPLSLRNQETRKCRIPSWRVGHLRHLPEKSEFNSLVHTRYSIYWREKKVNLKYYEYTRLASWPLSSRNQETRSLDVAMRQVN